MERPAHAKSIIRDNGAELKITIPDRWQLVYLILLIVMVRFGFRAESALYRALLDIRNPDYFGDYLFIPFIMIAPTLLAVVGFRYVWFRALGKETITVTQNSLIIDRKLLLLERRKTYNLSEIENLRWFDETLSSNRWGFKYRNPFKPFDNICFRYQLKPVRFGNNLDPYEAQYIVQLIKDKTKLAFAE